MGSVITNGDKISYVVTEKGKTVTYKENKKKNLVQVTIPASVTIDGVKYKVTEIAPNAFKDHKKLKKIVIGSNVTRIGKGAFQNCRSLTKVIIRSKKLGKIGKKAFYKAGAKNYKKLVVQVPRGKVKKYKPMLLKAKLSKKAIIK